MNILILTEGSSDLYFLAELLKSYLNYKTPTIIKNIEILSDKLREPRIKISTEKNKKIDIYLKNSISPNLSNFNKEVEEFGSLEKIYGFPPRTMTLIYTVYDYDRGSTNLQDLEKYVSFIDDGEFFPIISYPGYEGEALCAYYDEVLSNWSRISKERIKGKIIENEIFLEEDKFYYEENNYSIGSFLKLFREDIERKFKICNSSKCISQKKQSADNYLKKIFDKSLNKNHSYYLDNQSEILEKQNSLVRKKYVANFFFAILKDIKNELEV